MVNDMEVYTRKSIKAMIFKGLSGSKCMVCMKSNVRNLGDLAAPQKRSADQSKKRLHIGIKKSDFSIVL